MVLGSVDRRGQGNERRASVFVLDKGKNKDGKDHLVLYKQYN